MPATPHAGRAASETLCAEGYNTIFLELDVCDPVSITNATGTVSQKADHIDVLVNNAGILEHEGTAITSLNVESLDRTMRTNVNGPILMIQFFHSFLEKAPNGGRIINVSSGAGSLTTMQTYAPAYSISKTALNAVTRQFAACFKDKNIAVNSLDPGWVRTDMGGANASPFAGAGHRDTGLAGYRSPTDGNGEVLARQTGNGLVSMDKKTKLIRQTRTVGTG